MTAISPWARTAYHELESSGGQQLYDTGFAHVTATVILLPDSVWVRVSRGKGVLLYHRAVYAPGGGLEHMATKPMKDSRRFTFQSPCGLFTVRLSFPNPASPLIRCTTTFTPAADFFIPFWPRDLLIPEKLAGKASDQDPVHVRQRGSRSGLVYFTLPGHGTVLYLQNLSALNTYCELTRTSVADSVGGRWPELGFALPPAVDSPLPGEKAVEISDAFILVHRGAVKGPLALAANFMDLLAAVYKVLPVPGTRYQDWPSILQLGLRDLRKPGCWSQADGQAYLNAYVCDFTTPPEIMVQLAVLLPLVDYAEWAEKDLAEIDIIRKGLPAFYNGKLHTIMRWHPAERDKLTGQEEHKLPYVMDSWYLHHPLLNLSRMALKGDRVSKQLFLDSLPFAMKVARHFNYNWPVFYHMETLEVIKAETAPGKGGEKDVAGLYLHIMVQAYTLTQKAVYLREAKKAASTLAEKGFGLLYQANNTAFTAGALLRLYNHTRQKKYLDLSYLCLANIFANTRLWDCNYGYGKNFPSFFALFPLRDAPYTAVYEEQEVFCAFHDYLKQAGNSVLAPGVRLLLGEFIRHFIHRAAYYYPPMLPADMLAKKPKTGELDPKAWIAVEDLYDGWEKAGQVGQEVYGAGNAFGILPRHCIRQPRAGFDIFVDYPTGKVQQGRRRVEIDVLGTPDFSCRLMLLPTAKDKRKRVAVTYKNSRKPPARSKNAGGVSEFLVAGGSTIVVRW